MLAQHFLFCNTKTKKRLLHGKRAHSQRFVMKCWGMLSWILRRMYWFALALVYPVRFSTWAVNPGWIVCYFLGKSVPTRVDRARWNWNKFIFRFFFHVTTRENHEIMNITSSFTISKKNIIEKYRKQFDPLFFVCNHHVFLFFPSTSPIHLSHTSSTTISTSNLPKFVFFPSLSHASHTSHTTLWA